MLSYSIRPSQAAARRHPASTTNGTGCSSESSLPVRTRNNPGFAQFPPPLRSVAENSPINQSLTHLIFLAGLGQATILFASALVPFQLNWRDELRGLPRLHRQMHCVYGGYVVLSIIAFASLSIFNA